jgi:OOP family OmpA-OmpF porin
MRTFPLLASFLGATFMVAGVATTHAAEGVFYDPSNVGSTTGRTTGHELFGTIGCPGRQLLDKPCPVPAAAPAPVPAAAPAPADSDGDGVIDEKDKCPNTPAGRKVNADGCELDSDGDGVVDAKDKCPGTPAGRKVNADGCELDSDGDGVVDALDKCPTTPAGRKVNADGCELDSDGDGIVDGDDKCPTVFAKTADGCPAPLVLHGVNFDNNEAVLRLDAYPILDEAVKGLKVWGDVDVEVAGHTDSVGTDEHNLELSQRRAEAVRAYLIGKGISADRLVAKGYGEAQPVADNDTEEGRFKNRRVELSPVK